MTTARLEAGVITEVDDYMLPLSNDTQMYLYVKEGISSINELLHVNMHSMQETLSLHELYPKRMVRLLLEPHLVPTYR